MDADNNNAFRIVEIREAFFSLMEEYAKGEVDQRPI